MVDRKARDILAEQIRHLLAGVITNFQYIEEVDRLFTDDKGIRPIMNTIWQVYDDLREHKVDKTSFSLDDRKMLGRIILFLKSDLEYQWPSLRTKIPFFRLLSNIFTLGIYTRKRDQEEEKAGDFEYWPFISKADFELANMNPPYLAKQRTITKVSLRPTGEQ
jgi:hypothetical protein